MKCTATLPIVFLIVASTNACVSTKVELLVPPNKYPPVPAEEVRVFMAREEIAELGYEYEPVGMVFTSGHAYYTGQESMLRSTREKAGEIGANGLILGEIDEPGFWEWLFGGNERRSQMMAIRWWLPEEHPESGLAYQDSLMAMAPDAGDLYTFPNSGYLYGGQRVRVTAADLGIRNQAGRFEGFRGDTLVVAAAHSTMMLPVASVTRLELSWGRESLGGKGAAVGAVGGAAIGLIIGAPRVSACQEEEPRIGPGCGFLFFPYIVGGALAGVVLGGIVGETIKVDRWVEVPLDRLRVSLGPQRDGRFRLGLSARF